MAEAPDPVRPARLLAGGPVADAVLDDVARRTIALKEHGVTPGLGTILVGDDAASAGYVRKKHETCEAVGIRSLHRDIPADAGQPALLDAVREFNENADVDGYLIQHPVPTGFDFNEALLALDPDKDADGLHPINLGKLVVGEPGPVPCTPAGIKQMLLHYGIEVEGKHVVVVGRGTTLGRPLALLLSQKQAGANAAVTVVHTGVKDIAHYTRMGDIVVAAIGVPNFLTKDMVRPGAVVVGGGMTWEGRKAFSDVDEGVGEVASWVTPRLGGVGPMTVAILLRNCVEAAERRAGPA